MGDWYYKGEIFSVNNAVEKIADGYIGFIYEVTDNTNGKKYIGKKLLTTTKKLPPLKGTKRKRKKVVHSDWQTYYGSSELVKQLVEEREDTFSREILDFGSAKGELSYIEAKYHFDREVLLSDDYYNAFIGCKIHAKHVKNLWKK
jgi:hypothetical protein